MEVYSTGFLVDGNSLGFLASDSDKNTVLFQYQPESKYNKLLYNFCLESNYFMCNTRM
jgi:hypothetical protein